MREKIKDMFLNDTSIDDICAILNISRSTFYYHKREDLKKGINWDVLLLEHKRDEFCTKEKEAMFLSTLIKSFENFIQQGQNLDPQTIEKLHKYATTYWRLKAPKNDDEFFIKQKQKKLIQKTIEEIANLAISHENQEVTRFLSNNAEQIINATFKDI